VKDHWLEPIDLFCLTNADGNAGNIARFREDVSHRPRRFDHPCTSQNTPLQVSKGTARRQPQATAICATVRVSPSFGQPPFPSHFLMQLSGRASKQGADERTPVNKGTCRRSCTTKGPGEERATSATGQTAVC